MYQIKSNVHFCTSLLIDECNKLAKCPESGGSRLPSPAPQSWLLLLTPFSMVHLWPYPSNAGVPSTEIAPTFKYFIQWMLPIITGKHIGRLVLMLSLFYNNSSPSPLQPQISTFGPGKREAPQRQFFIKVKHICVTFVYTLGQSWINQTDLFVDLFGHILYHKYILIC